MTKVLVLILALLSTNVFGQKDPSKLAQSIVEEGKLLYKSEIASWHGTDLFLEKYKDRSNVGGYLSYTEGVTTKNIFFSKSTEPKIIGTISFDSTFNEKTAQVDLNERDFTLLEKDLFEIRKIALTEINSDTLFKKYNNTSLNLIPIIIRDDKKVYVLTGPQQNGVVIFGNDYVLLFDKNNKLKSKQQLHKNIIPIPYKNDDKQTQATMHSHLPETGDLITATDVCTLILYGKYAKWKTHNVVSAKYLNIWNCETNQLNVISMETVKKINKDQEERNKSKQ
ncbi:hypothetical protein GCM10027578_20910 [Spirosoma luteolum]